MSSPDVPHRRLNLLTGEWVLVSPNRTQRPWLGAVEQSSGATRRAHEPGCYLCPRNERAGGERNPDYTSTYVFTNDYPALLPDTTEGYAEPSMLKQQPVRGTNRVVCFSPRHDVTLPEMSVPQIREVVDVWATQTSELGQSYKWVQVFENKGEIMGCSNPHPHGQIWALDAIPNEPAKEAQQQRAFLEETHGGCLLREYLQAEIVADERIVLVNGEWVALVPFWAVWPFELLLVPRRHTLRLPELTTEQRDALADILKRLLTRYDNLFETSFPYSMGWHGAPFESGDQNHWQLHAHFYPPLLRSADVKKFMVGFEMLGEPQRDFTAEVAAARLRSLPDTHYKTSGD